MHPTACPSFFQTAATRSSTLAMEAMGQPGGRIALLQTGTHLQATRVVADGLPTTTATTITTAVTAVTAVTTVPLL